MCHSGGGGVLLCIQGWGLPPGEEPPPGGSPWGICMQEGTPPPLLAVRDMVHKRAVHILLECILVHRCNWTTWAVLVLLIFLHTFSECQILWSLCSVVFLAFTLKLPIQTSLSVVPKLLLCVGSSERCQNFRRTSTPRGNCSHCATVTT